MTVDIQNFERPARGAFARTIVRRLGRPRVGASDMTRDTVTHELILRLYYRTSTRSQSTTTTTNATHTVAVTVVPGTFVVPSYKDNRVTNGTLRKTCSSSDFKLAIYFLTVCACVCWLVGVGDGHNES